MNDELTKSAISATLHCLTGCAVGEIVGMVAGTALNLSNLVTMILAIILAFFFGFLFSFRTIKKSGVDVKKAVRLTLAADTLSITSMEIVDNTVILLIPSAIHARLNDGLFWWSLALSLVIAFIVTVPVNRYLIKRGKGHAVVHHMHHH